MIRVLSVIVNGHWRPGIGDPTFIGWLITAEYLVTSVFCGICAMRTGRISPIDRSRFHRLFWWGLAVIMLIMGTNKQLDLQCLFIAVIKKMALAQGWSNLPDVVHCRYCDFWFGFDDIVRVEIETAVAELRACSVRYRAADSFCYYSSCSL